ncbi:GNAT family protein [Clostridium perfringens]|uniref:GNAT family N-acetyltransferase n=1 Tax=Clostridium perfringens TaxID=1502 RepID=UPI000706D790|nr:GNAT family protein [Clostridium perfringens]ALG47881.1 Ribosomal-protein-S5p-alanine acetyltransferase [Clostridium perfringens]MBI6063500.1 GNAT family N-acetyltransferase [Clostridium perfringens]MDH2471036.1 GNAT family protein [Clostridium perfringens]MDK0545219.1 GNAT family protein [Clostridium perfringens]MDK0806267.1 GNAT family protein [Clostridium perfringens]
MNIKGKVVTLRAIEERDMDLLKDMLNDQEIERLVGGWAFPVSSYQQKRWYESNINDNKNIRLIIETNEDGAIGLATLTNIDWKNRVAFHGIKLANKKYRARGIGTDSVMAIMRYAFTELQLNRLDGAIIEYNEGSRKLYCNKCGWSVEGIQRKKIFKNGSYHNRLIVGILKEDYYELIRENNYWGE